MQPPLDQVKWAKPIDRPNVEGVFGSYTCPNGCGRFALFPDQRLVPPHLTSAIERQTDTRTGKVVRERQVMIPCPISGNPFR